MRMASPGLKTFPARRSTGRDVVPLRITPRTPTETAFWVEKPLTAFRLEADSLQKRQGVDRLHRQAFLIYSYRNGREEPLRLGADLFHLLLELSDGYQLGDVSTDDTFAHLSIFVQRLLREDESEMLAWNPMQDEAIYQRFRKDRANGTRSAAANDPGLAHPRRPVMSPGKTAATARAHCR